MFTTAPGEPTTSVSSFTPASWKLSPAWGKSWNCVPNGAPRSGLPYSQPWSAIVFTIAVMRVVSDRSAFSGTDQVASQTRYSTAATATATPATRPASARAGPAAAAAGSRLRPSAGSGPVPPAPGPASASTGLATGGRYRPVVDRPWPPA